MATLVLGAFGTLVGGPLGGAIGALAGRQIDGAIIGGSGREGPRLKELAITTSSYGAPLPRHVGRMRVAGTIVWGTELQESKEKSGGGKGQPKTTTYSYSSSFAVALASCPIERIGRIWADGNLLRGTAGDLKVGGAMRVYRGHGDQAPDPLIAADRGAAGCPAFRGIAYVVFEDLQLGEFSNRIPALTFEIIVDSGVPDLRMIVGEREGEVDAAMSLTGLTGFTYEGGPLSDTLETIDILYPIVVNADGDQLTLQSADTPSEPVATLPPPTTAADDGDFGTQDGRRRERLPGKHRTPRALRYYDRERDYQPGIQRAVGRAQGGAEAIIQFPGTFDAGAASKHLARAVARARASGERLRWRTGELNEHIMPGRHVRLPRGYDDTDLNDDDLWIVEEWEWRETGIELDLRRLPPGLRSRSAASDSGAIPIPTDALAGPTILRAFELPWNGEGSSNDRRIHVAAGSTSAAWKGATIYRDGVAGLEPLAASGREPAAIGTLVEPLASSPGILLDEDASMKLDLQTAHPGFRDATRRELATGANRLLVGSEILQFMLARQISERRWTLTGLLRGRGGTETEAAKGHRAGTNIVLLDDALLAIDPASATVGSADSLAAIGFGDEEPVLASIAELGRFSQPLSPVHGHAMIETDGSIRLTWVRRARGAYRWLDGVEVPLNEEAELYAVGNDDPATTSAQWQTDRPELRIDAADLAYGPLWVRQIGRAGQSPALRIPHPHPHPH